MKTKFLFVITLIVGLTCHVHAFADDLPTVYGFKLGSQPTLPSCTDDAARDLTKFPGIIYYKVACFEKYDFSTPERLSVVFPSDETPSLADGGRISLGIYEGTIEAISWSTRGVYDADKVIDALTKKFGKPTQANKTPILNMKGQQFLSWSVTWKRTGFLVNYETISFLEQINHGVVRIATDSAEKRRLLEQEKRQTAKKNPL